MTESWVPDPNQFGMWYGVLVGGMGGTLLGLLGGLCGHLAPRGKGERWVVGGLRLLLFLGVCQCLGGVSALAAGQPYAVWYPPTICGLIYAVPTGCLLGPVRRAYSAASARRLDAQSFRNA